MFFKKSFFFALALSLVLAGKAMAGPNATSVIGMDIDASGNATNGGVTSATAAGTATITVELFTSPIAGPVVGADIVFDLDPTILGVSSFAQATGLFALGTTANSVSIGAIPSGTLSAAGYWGAVTFTPAKDVTGLEFSVGITRYVVVDAATSGSPDTLTTTTAAVVVNFDQQSPVELATFAGEVAKDNVVLNWSTASQTNNAGFRVLRSTDQENYELVSELISGAGTTDVLMPYSFTDISLPAAEQVFYVLEQIDLDGTIHRSNPIEVVLGARFLNLPSEFASAVYPNPFNPATTISYDMPVEGNVSIVIYDAIGQEIRQLVNSGHSAGRYSLQWDAKDALGRNVGSGVYIAKIKAGTFSATQKMLLLK